MIGTLRMLCIILVGSSAIFVTMLTFSKMELTQESPLVTGKVSIKIQDPSKDAFYKGIGSEEGPQWPTNKNIILEELVWELKRQTVIFKQMIDRSCDESIGEQSHYYGNR